MAFEVRIVEEQKRFEKRLEKILKAVEDSCDVAFFLKVTNERLLPLYVLRFDNWLVLLHKNSLETGNKLR